MEILSHEVKSFGQSLLWSLIQMENKVGYAPTVAFLLKIKSLVDSAWLS